ncbi:MAG: glycosyltransferase family 1 protein, partial [Candidatus Chisholmbacteria bacterium]|nr:glycosyltransferase family 1 protein [Candidatus Chisholmbacteria bacterium]
AGLPVVASQAGSLPEIYQDAALYFDPQSVADLTAKLQAVLTDQTLVKNLQAKGRQLAQTYSWTTTAQKTLQVYQKFL